jgi:tetratricopeptide (TPR) repeat protein
MPNTPPEEPLQELESALKKLNKGQLGQKDIQVVKQAMPSGRIIVASDGGVAIGGDATENIFIILTADAMKILLRPVPHEIPQAPSDFTGRDNELGELLEHFERGAIIVGVRGLGGIGKTALACRLSEYLEDYYPDGQLKVDLQGTYVKPLRPIEAMSQIIRSFDRAIHLPENESELSGIYQSMLNDKHCLLLLDNALDHHQVMPLLPPSTCGLLVTSRRKFALPGLKSMDLDILKPKDARDLLLTIAEWIGDDADALAQLCGYLPLALRAAGSLLANTPDLDPAEYVDELRAERTRLREFGSEGVDRDVEASFNLSYCHLSTETAKVFRMLSIFPIDFDAKAEEAICQDYNHQHLRDLVKWCLVEFHKENKRYHLHDLARIFAARRHEQIDEERSRFAAQYRHAEYYKNVLSNSENLYLDGGNKTHTGLKQFDTDRMNIQTAYAWIENVICQEEQRDLSSIELINILNLSNFFLDSGKNILRFRLHPSERIRWLETALVSARQLNDPIHESNHLVSHGTAYIDLGDYRNAIKILEQALKIASKFGNKIAEGYALDNMGAAYNNLSNYRRAIELLEQALIIARETGDKKLEGML